MKMKLLSIGYYVSPQGGAVSPYEISEGRIVFELITAGVVYDPLADNLLCGPGWIFAHLPGQKTVSQSEPTGHYECTTIVFETTLVKNSNIWLRSFLWDDEKSAVSFSHEMLYAFHHTDMDRTVLGDLIWSQLRFRLENYKRHESRKEIPPRISEVMSYIDRYYTAALGIEELADHVKLSASHLHARFKEFVGMTPHHYLIRQRMRSARHMLATGDLPIKAVAGDIGYANPESFCRAFKQHFGITAAGYRRKYMIYQ